MTTHKDGVLRQLGNFNATSGAIHQFRFMADGEHETDDGLLVIHDEQIV